MLRGGGIVIAAEQVCRFHNENRAHGWYSLFAAG
jgi:hypothetical protein